MGEGAAFPRAVGAVAAGRCRGVLVAAHWVCAVREEPADLLGVMGFELCWGWVASLTFGVFAGDAEAAGVGHIDGCVVGGCRRDVRVGAVLIDAAFIKFAHCG